MTFSILARDPASGAYGIAIASRFFAVGALCPFVFSGLGAFSTQALGHPPFGARAGRLLADGLAAEQVIARLLEGDAERERGQLHVIDVAGRIAAHTGAECIAWAGVRQGRGVSLAGNMLAGPAVLDEAIAAFEASDAPFAEKLLLALEAGQRAGGDKRGQQAAALLIHGAAKFPMVSLRVDDHEQAVAELRRLHREAYRDYYPYVRRLFGDEDVAAVLG